MELKLTLSNPRFNTAIPVDYQYYLSSWVYGVLEKGDAAYSKFLHEQGYAVANDSLKRFKLFCFSGLEIAAYQLDRDRELLYIQSEQFCLYLRFHIGDALENFIAGVFKDQTLILKTGFDTTASFEIVRVETSWIKQTENQAWIATKSPIVLSTKSETGHEQYLSPLDEGYTHVFFHNLLDKFKATGADLPPFWDVDKFGLEIVNKRLVRSKLVRIRKNNREDIRVKGYHYEFKIIAPSEIIQVGLEAGFGKYSASGFGFSVVRTIGKKVEK